MPVNREIELKEIPRGRDDAAGDVGVAQRLDAPQLESAAPSLDVAALARAGQECRLAPQEQHRYHGERSETPEGRDVAEMVDRQAGDEWAREACRRETHADEREVVRAVSAAAHAAGDALHRDE